MDFTESWEITKPFMKLRLYTTRAWVSPHWAGGLVDMSYLRTEESRREKSWPYPDPVPRLFFGIVPTRIPPGVCTVVVPLHLMRLLYFFKHCIFHFLELLHVSQYAYRSIYIYTHRHNSYTYYICWIHATYNIEVYYKPFLFFFTPM